MMTLRNDDMCKVLDRHYQVFIGDWISTIGGTLSCQLLTEWSSDELPGLKVLVLNQGYEACRSHATSSWRVPCTQCSKLRQVKDPGNP